MIGPTLQPIIVKGIVEQGSGDGRKIGFPTANISLPYQPPLEYGVYSAVTILEGISHKSILHYGPRLIVGETHPLFEVHIFDFNKMIYGKEVTIEVRAFIRKTQSFPSFESMKEQIQEDCKKAKRLL